MRSDMNEQIFHLIKNCCKFLRVNRNDRYNPKKMINEKEFEKILNLNKKIR